MTAILWAFDVVLAVTLVALAAGVLATASLFRSIVLFIVFGLTMTIAWARLDAVDLGLVEAAVGAGLTGALLLNTLGHMRSQADFTPEPSRGPVGRLALALAAGTAGLAIGAAVWAWPDAFAGLGDRVDAQLVKSGAENPVTAVLLNFRAYDTLLEIGVLVVAVVAVWALSPMRGRVLDADPPGPVLAGFIHLLVPVVVLVAGYLLWIGTDAPGGAFQAGAVLAAAGVLLLITGRVAPPQLQAIVERGAVVLGLVSFLAVGVAVMAGGHAFLELPDAWAKALILLLESLLTISIAIVLVVLFAGGRIDMASAPENEAP